MKTFSINTDIATQIADHYKIGVQKEIKNTHDTLCRELLERSLELNGTKLQSVLEASFFASYETEEGSWDSDKEMVSVFRHAEYLFADF